MDQSPHFNGDYSLQILLPGITACDPQFIARAMEMGIPCITGDRELQGKFAGIAPSRDVFLGASAGGSVGERRSRIRLRSQR